jgi:putative DNA primase/helicase
VGESLAAVDGVTNLYEGAAARYHWQIMSAAKSGDRDTLKRLEAQHKAILKKITCLQKLDWKRSVLQLAAAGKDSLGITGEQWDMLPRLLPCANGVVDLRTGDFRDGQPSDFLKTVCPTEWTGIDTPAPNWADFLWSIFEDESLISFWGRLCGSSIPGEVVEHVLPILYGEMGRNSKGSMFETLKHVLGPLAGPIPAELLLRQAQTKNPDAASSSLMALRGKRLVWASETERGQALVWERLSGFVAAIRFVAANPMDADRLISRLHIQPSYSPTTDHMPTRRKPHSGNGYF